MLQKFLANGDGTVSYTYDGNSNLLTSSYNGTQYRSYMYNYANLPILTNLSYDGTYAQYSETTNYRGFVTEQKSYTDDTERVNTFAHDYVGNVITATDNMGNVTATEYNALNNPVKVTYADGTSVQTVWGRGSFCYKSLD